MLSLEQIEQARSRISSHVSVSSLNRSAALSDILARNVFLKMETDHETGSFKVRGAVNKLAILKSQGIGKVVTASTGNHGAAVSFAGQRLSMEVVVFVPEIINGSKLEKLESFGVEIHKVGNDGIVAEGEARLFSKRHEIPYVSPYNDYDVMAGQGSIGLEILEQLSSVDKIYVSLGGGGLVGGIGKAITESESNAQVIACSPVNSAVMYESLKSGKILDLDSLPTISDGTAGGLETGSVTFDVCQDVIHSHVVVEEDLIRKATSMLNYDLDIRSEGAAGLALAGAISDLENRSDQSRNIVVILCGANIDQATLESLR